MINTSFTIPNIKPVYSIQKIPFINTKDSFYTQNPNINSSILVQKGIIENNQDVNAFFDNISKTIFYDDYNNANALSSCLKNGDIMLSTAILNGINKSAVAISLDENNLDYKKLENIASNGLGIGINFSNFKNPTLAIKNINSTFKQKENLYKKPPAFIGLLDINHPKILDFITLKNNQDFNKWCFDLSVIINDEFMKKLENYDKDSIIIYNTLLNSMSNFGEPGVIFSNDKKYITDCCAAACLKENETLVNSSINLNNMINNGNFDYNKLNTCASILSKALKKIDTNSYISILGYCDMLNKLNLKYGSNEANKLLSNILNTIKKYNKITLPPTSTTSRILKTTPSIEPSKENEITIDDKLKTLATCYKYIEGQVSTTINIKNPTRNDADYIIKYCYENGIKGITIYPKN